jgi:hypothetical protein
MIGRRSVFGLALLSALALSAFATQSASAAKATNTTAFTCVKGGGALDFADAHCGQNVGAKKGEYGHVAIPLGQKTEGETTNQNVTGSTKESEPATLKSKVAGVKITIQCAAVKGKGTGVQEEKEGKHTGSGEGTTEFTLCEVKELTKCTVREPIVATVTGEALEKLGPGENEMGGEARQVEGKPITQILFENKGEEACALNGKTFNVTGSAIVTSGPTTESSQTTKWTGATAVYTPKNGMQSLKLGAETAELSLITTVTANGIPLSGTTVT